MITLKLQGSIVGSTVSMQPSILALQDLWGQISCAMKELGADGRREEYPPMSLREAVARIPHVIEMMASLASESHTTKPSDGGSVARLLCQAE
eukprot:761684-Hanusia_phi.AAC.7